MMAGFDHVSTIAVSTPKRYLWLVPLVPTALEELRGAHIFSKLGLRSAYNLIQILQG